MLSLSGVSPGMAGSYYSKDDYYFRDQKKGEVVLGQERAGGHFIEADRMRELVGQRERVADDLTFSAPKSVSLIAALDDNHRADIIQAHSRAVQAVMEYIVSSGMVQSRDDKGLPVSVNKDSVVAVKFDHFLSRNQDPQLHSHVLLLNSVEREDGEIRAAYLREVYLNKKSLGAMYRLELAANLERLGYQVEWRKDGTFEIKGFTPEQLRAFSTRRAEIEQRMKELGFEGGKAAEIATKDTRKVKEERVDYLALRTAWEQRAKETGIQIPTPTLPREKTQTEQKVEAVSKRLMAEEVARKQVFTAGFTMHHRVELELARELARQGYTTRIAEIQALTREALPTEGERHGGVHLLDCDRMGRERLTFMAAPKADAKAEVRGLRENQVGLDVEKACETLEQFQTTLQKEKGFQLSEAQVKAVLGIATATHDTAVVGRAGAGKTTMMQALRDIYAVQGKGVIGVSFTGAAAKNLEKEAGIKSFTIDSLSFRKDPLPEHYQGGLIIVDEAGMVDSLRASAVQEFAEQNGMKIVWVGDPQQTKPVGVGSPFEKFLKEGVEKGAVFEISEIHRQKDLDYLRAAYSAAQGNFQEAIHIFQDKGWIHELTKGEAVQMAVEKYLTSLAEEKTQVIVADKNKDVERLNREIRFHLQREGIVEKEGLVVQTRDTTGKPTGEKEFCVGDRVMFLRNSRELGVRNGEIGQVVGISGGTMTIDLHGEKIKVDTEKYAYLTHGYAMTVHKSQGLTADRVFYLAYGNHPTQEKFYVAITRGKEECIIATRDMEEFIQNLESEQKIDIAGWTYGREGQEGQEHSADGKLLVSEREVETFQAKEEIQNLVIESAAMEAWHSLPEERQIELIEEKATPEKLEAVRETIEQAIERAGEWHPGEEKASVEEVAHELSERVDQALDIEHEDHEHEYEHEEGRDHEHEQEHEHDPLAEVPLEEPEYDRQEEYEHGHEKEEKGGLER